MSAYEPGMVALVDFEGKTFQVFWDHCNEEWVSAEDGRLYPSPRSAVTNIRPLVVLDLGERAAETVRHLRDCNCSTSTRGCISARDVADQIEAQTKPPRIPEPGLWGVVEASLPGETERRHFVHHDMAYSKAAAWHESCGGWRAWEDLIDPTLVRDGVES